MVANWDSKCSGITGDIFHVLHGLIQVTKGLPCGSPSELYRLQFRYKEQDQLLGTSNSPCASQRKRKAFKDGGTHRGLANSRNRAVISRPAGNHHTAHLRSAPQVAGPGPGCCRRQGQVGRTLSRSPPPRPAALRSRQ